MDIPWTLGAYEIGVLFGTILYGIVLAEAFRYTQEKFKDPMWLKLLVLFVCIIDTAHTVAIWSLLYSWSVDNFGNSDGILKIHWMFILAFAVSPSMGAFVQAFFAYRMFVLLSRPYLPIIVWVGASTRLGFSIFRIVPFAQSKTLPKLVERYGWTLVTGLSINLGLDTINTCGLLYCLLKDRPKLPRSQKMVDKLSRYTVEIGLTTTVFAAITLGLIHYRAHDNFIFLAFFAIYPKLFTNSFLASLNARAGLRESSRTTNVCAEPESPVERKKLFRINRRQRTIASASDPPRGTQSPPIPV